MKRKGYIYEYISPSGKYYIGLTINLKARKHSHKKAIDKKSLLDRAIKKYGIENFKFNLLFFTESENVSKLKTILNALEIYYIRKYKKEGKILYNISEGGGLGCPLSWTSEMREHMRLVMLNRRKNGFKGRTFISEESRKLIGRANSKQIGQYSLDNKLIKIWCSARQAAIELNLSYTAINNVLKGRAKTSGNYLWKYI